MRNIVGKLACFAVFFFASCAAHQTFDLRLYDLNGRRIKKVYAGKPFLLRASIEGVSRATNTLTITGLEAFDVQRSICRLTSVNGRSIVTHERQLRAHRPATHIIGPAEFTDNGITYRSNKIKIEVCNATSANEKEKEDEQDDSKLAFLRLEVDKDNVVVGEKVTCVLTCYYQGSELALGNVKQPKFDGWHLAQQAQEARGKKEIDGITYDVVVLAWQMSPNKPGKSTIPAFGADFLQEAPSRQFQFGFGMFRQSMVDTKRVYSNACTVNVQSLPAHDTQVNAVGEFTNFTARVDHPVVKAGEGMVLTLELTGDGDWQQVLYDQLQHMPDEFKWYESKQSVGQNVKQFEFVVQGMQPGNFEVPAQTFTYFDTKTKGYKTLATTPIMLNVQENTGAAAVLPAHQIALDSSGEVDTIAPLQERGALFARTKRALPWWLVWLLIFGPLIFWLTYAARRLFAWRIEKQLLVYKKRRAFAQAHKMLHAIKQAQNYVHVYPLFIELFSLRLQVAKEHISQQSIERALRAAGMSDEQRRAWNVFFERCAACAFAQTTQDARLFDEAQRWIDVLKGVL